MHTLTQAERDALMAPERLLDLMPVDDNLLVGFEMHDDGIAIHLAPLDLCSGQPAATALFGIHAPPNWDAAGVALSGRLRRFGPQGPAEVLHSESSACVVMHRDGREAHRLYLDGRESDPATLPAPEEAEHPLVSAAHGPSGFVTDALARVLGLPAPGDPPRTSLLTLHIWSTLIVASTFGSRRVDRVRLVERHPSGIGFTSNPAMVSAEALIDATFATSKTLNWHRLRTAAMRTASDGFAISASEVQWMDVTMYARWSLTSMHSPLETLETLRRHDIAAASLFSDVIDGVVDRW